MSQQAEGEVPRLSLTQARRLISNVTHACTHTLHNVGTKAFSAIQGLTGQCFYSLSQRTMAKGITNLSLFRENTFI